MVGVKAMSDFDSYDVKHLREQLGNEELPALREAGLLSPERIDYLESYRENYSPGQAPHFETGEPAYWYYNSKQYVQVIRRELGKTLSQAVRNGNHSLIQHANGLSSSNNVEMDFVDYHRFKEVLETPALMLNIFASPREGKTFTAARICDLWLMFHPNGLVVSNIKSWAEIHPQGAYEYRMPDIIKATKQHDGPVMLFLDELSSDGTHKELQKSGIESGLRSFFRHMGKEPYTANYIGIGHRVVEVAPMLRSGEVAYFGFKEGATKEAARKHLVVYEDADKQEEVVDLRGIGLPDYSPDTNDPAHLDWGREQEYIDLGLMNDDEDVDEGGSDVDLEKARLRAKEEMVLGMHRSGQSYSDIADSTSIPKSTVGDMVQRAKNRDESSEEQ